MQPCQTSAIDAEVRGNGALPFLEAKQLKLFIGSWNVNANIEDICNMDMWIPLVDHSTGQKYDIIAIGLQEMIALSASNVVGSAVASIADEKAAKWETLIKRYLLAASACADALGVSSTRAQAGDEIHVVASCHMVGLWIGVFARSRLMPHITGVQSGNVACGAGGVLGNKGAVCVRMQVYDTSICFTCAHLAAHQTAVNKRNDDFHAIMCKGVFLDDNITSVLSYKEKECFSTTSATKVKSQVDSMRKRVGRIDESLLMSTPTATSELGRRVQIGEHDMIFFFGDLNYRINENNRTLDDIYAAMAEDLELLKLDDQLNIERAAGRCFNGFSEGSLAFLPTYKFIAGTAEYDRRPDKKMRLPAWCDRILWRLGNRRAVPSVPPPPVDSPGTEATSGTSQINTSDSSDSKISGATTQSILLPLQGNEIEKVEQLRYQRSDNIISDHRPISSSFNITLKSIFKEGQDYYTSELYDRVTQQDIARFSVSPPCIYARSASTALLTNTVSVKNLSIGSRGSFSIAATTLPVWLTVEPSAAVLDPMESLDLKFIFHPSEAKASIPDGVEQNRYELNAIVDLGVYDQCGAVIHFPVSILATL